MEAFNFNNITPAINITTDYILSKIDEQVIFYYYFGRFELNKVYQSKFRADKTPSTGFYINKKKVLTYHDLKTGEKLDCWNFVAKLYGLTFKQALYKIANDFGLCKGCKLQVPEKVFLAAKTVDLEAKEPTLIQFIPDKFNSSNLLYWRYYEITKDELVREEIYPVKKLFINHKEISCSTEQRYAIVVNYRDEDELKTGLKILSPTDLKMKWLSSVPLWAVGDLETMPHLSKNAFVCKSKKDKIVLSKWLTDCCWTQNESKTCFPENAQQKLLTEYEKTYLVYGADPHGVEQCQTYNTAGFLYFNTPKIEYEKYQIEDPADYIKSYGCMAFEKLLIEKNLL